MVKSGENIKADKHTAAPQWKTWGGGDAGIVQHWVQPTWNTMSSGHY